MSKPLKLPSSGRIAYVGPALRPEAAAEIEAAGYELTLVEEHQSELPFGAAMLVYAAGVRHPHLAALQRDAVAAGIPDITDLSLLSHLSSRLRTSRKQRVLITGSAGKSTTAALLRDMLGRAKLEARIIGAEGGYLNALGSRAAFIVLTVMPDAVSRAERVGFGAAAVLNLVERDGHDPSSKTKAACAEALTAAPFGVLGTDDVAAQSLLMTIRRMSGSSAREIVPVSGGSTLSGGYFAIDRVLYGAKLGRTRRVSSFTEGSALIGDHFGQSAAAAAALATFFGCNDEQIGAALNAYQGLPGRFDCVAAKGRIVFIDDRAARTVSAAAASIGACPDVFWIGHRAGSLPKRIKEGVRGSFFLRGPDGSGPPVDNVTTFEEVGAAARAALRAAEELLLREPEAAPVLLFAPGRRGFDEAGAAFARFAAETASEGDRIRA
jgi:UDP-N-acetylmuramoylalanine--D-glutamate ligase